MIRRLRRSKRVACVERFVFEKEVQIPVIVASPCLRDDFHSTIADAAEFRAEGVVVDSDFLDLVLRGNPAASETIDHEIAAATGASARTCDLLQIRCQLVVGHRVDKILPKDRGVQARIRVDADFVPGLRHFDVLSDLGQLHGHRQRSHIRRHPDDFGIRIKIRRGHFELIFAGIDRNFEISASRRRSFLDHLLALVDLYLNARHDRPRCVHNAPFDFG